MLPKEHGAWAMLLVPFVVGTAAGGHLGVPSALLLASTLLLFSASRPLELALRGKREALPVLLAELALGSISGLALVTVYGLWRLLPIALAAGVPLAIVLMLRRHAMERSWPARLLSIAALSATGPAAYYCGTGNLDRTALAVWLITFLYSGASVFYVRLLSRRRANGETEGGSGAKEQMAIYLVVAVAVLAFSASQGWSPAAAPLALVPLIAKAIWASRRPDYRPSIKQIGFAEMGHATIFGVVAVAILSTM